MRVVVVVEHMVGGCKSVAVDSPLVYFVVGGGEIGHEDPGRKEGDLASCAIGVGKDGECCQWY